MGACCFPRNSIIYRIDTITNYGNLNQNILTTNEKSNEIFNNMPEVEEEIYVNYGIKRMKAYKCNLHIDELNNLREKFWQLKISLNERYKFLRQAVLYDSNKCEEYLIKNGFLTINGYINQCTDNTKYVYNIPNYCINDPYFEKELEKVNFDREKSKICIFLKLNDIKEKFIFDDDITGKEIKEEFLKRKNLDMENYFKRIRLFFGGNEIHDNEFLYQHKLKDNYSIQVNIC